MNDLRTRAQLVLMSRALGADEAEVAFLGAACGPDELRELRERITATLFDEQAPRYRRVTELSRLLPTAVLAKVAQFAVGPVMGGRVVGLVPVDKAVGLVGRLPTDYLAAAAAEMDPRQVAEFLPQVPIGPMVEIVDELLRRGDHVTLARLLALISDEQLLGLAEHVTDDEGLARVAFYVEPPSALDRLVRVLPAERVRAIVRAVATGPVEVRLAGLSLLAQLCGDLAGQLADLAARLGDDAIGALAGAAIEGDAGAELLTALGAMSRESLLRLAQSRVVDDDRLLPVLVRAATTHDRREVLDRVLDQLDPRHRERADRLASEGGAP